MALAVPGNLPACVLGYPSHRVMHWAHEDSTTSSPSLQPLGFTPIYFPPLAHGRTANDLFVMRGPKCEAPTHPPELDGERSAPLTPFATAETRHQGTHRRAIRHRPKRILNLRKSWQ